MSWGAVKLEDSNGHGSRRRLGTLILRVWTTSAPGTVARGIIMVVGNSTPFATLRPEIGASIQSEPS